MPSADERKSWAAKPEKEKERAAATGVYYRLMVEHVEKVSQMSYFLNSKHKDHANADGKMTEEQKREYLKEYEAKVITPAEASLRKRGASNAGYHYLGCAKTFALMGKAFAEATLHIGKGAIPYGDHHPWTETHEDNGKCGMTAVLFSLLGEAKGAEVFSRMSLASHGPERDCGHTGNFFNMLWAMPGVALSGPNATGAWMKEFGGWYLDLARQWDGTFAHQGPPEPGRDSHHGWDASGGYLLACAMPLKKIYVTGKRPSAVPKLDATAAQSLILDGRGWNNKDHKTACDKLDVAELMTRLGS